MKLSRYRQELQLELHQNDENMISDLSDFDSGTAFGVRWVLNMSGISGMFMYLKFTQNSLKKLKTSNEKVETPY